MVLLKYLKQLREVLAAYWQPLLFCGALVSLLTGLLWFRLGSLPGGYSPSEQATLQASNSFGAIWNNPVNAPFTVVARLFVFIGGHNLLWMRMTAVLFGLLVLTAFYWLVRYWHGERSAVLGTMLFGTSAWFLHTVRLGTPDVLLLLFLAMAACFIWARRADNRLAVPLGLGLATALMYVPGMVWLLIIGAVWQFRAIVRLLKHHPGVTGASAGGALLLLAPLGLAIYRSPELAKILAGLPANGWPQPLESLKRLAEVPINLFWRGPTNPEHWLDGLPVLATFTMAMLVLGVYLYARHWRLARSHLIGGVLFVGMLLISLGGTVGLSIIMPAVYLLAAAGIGFMLDRWQQVFPRNVIAQSVSIALISVAVALTCWYNLRRYFVAWPAVPATRQTFVVQQHQ